MSGLKCTTEASIHYKLLFTKGDVFCLQEAANIPDGLQDISISKTLLYPIKLTLSKKKHGK